MTIDPRSALQALIDKWRLLAADRDAGESDTDRAIRISLRRCANQVDAVLASWPPDPPTTSGAPRLTEDEEARLRCRCMHCNGFHASLECPPKVAVVPPGTVPPPPPAPAVTFQCPYAECIWPKCFQQPECFNRTLCAGAMWQVRMAVKIERAARPGDVTTAPRRMNRC